MSMFDSISGTFNQLASVAASLQNLDELQDGEKTKTDADDNSVNKQKQSLDATNIGGSSSTITVTSSNFSSFNFFGQSNGAAAINADLLETTSQGTNIALEAAKTTVTTKQSNKIAPEIPVISHELCDKEISRLTSELDIALNKFQQIEVDMKTQENKHLKIVDKYKVKLKETKDQTTSLREELNNLSKRYEDKLNQLQQQASSTATTEALSNTATTQNNIIKANDITDDHTPKPSSFFDDGYEKTSSTVDGNDVAAPIETIVSNPQPSSIMSQELEIALEKYYLQEHAFDSAKLDWEAKESEYNETIEQNNKELTELTRKYQDSLNKIQEIESLYSDEKKELAISQSETAVYRSQHAVKVEFIKTLESQLIEKDTTITDWQEKMKLLTDKIRDLMTKYTTLKGKYQLLEQADEKSAEIGEAMQTKESELLSIRLKLDNALQKVQEEHNSRMDLADRYGETQRELTRQQETLQHVQLSLESTVKEREIAIKTLKQEHQTSVENMIQQYQQAMKSATEEYKSSLESLTQENTVLSTKLNDLTSLHTTKSTQYQESGIKCKSLETTLQNLQQQHKLLLADKDQLYQSKLQQQEYEITNLTEKLSLQNNAETNLEDYKKRAQQAMKKANNQLSELNIEVQRLKLQLSEAQEKSDMAVTASFSAETQAKAKAKEEGNNSSNENNLATNNQIRHLEEELNQIKSALVVAESRSMALEQEKGQLEESIKSSMVQRSTATAIPPLNTFTISSSSTADSDDDGDVKADAIHTNNYINSSRSDMYNDSSSKSVTSAVSNNNNNYNNTSSRSGGGQNSARSVHSSSDTAATNVATTNNSTSSITTSISQSQLARVTAATAAAMADLENNPSFSNSSSYSSNNNNVRNGSESPSSSHNQFTTSTAPPLYLVNELYTKLDEARRQSRAVEQENSELSHNLLEQKNQKRQLATRVEELMAFLDRTKQMRSSSSSSSSANSNNTEEDAMVSMEYLKNCVYKFMVSDDVKDKIRLSNVISTILKLTTQERKEVSRILEAELHRVNRVDESITNIASFATSFFGGSATPLKQSQSQSHV